MEQATSSALPLSNITPIKMPATDAVAFSAALEKLQLLCNGLPASVPQGVRNGRVKLLLWDAAVPTNSEEAWEKFNSAFDALYGEDCRDPKTNRLPNISRGRFGMDLVCSYIRNFAAVEGMYLNLMVIKVDRLINEVAYLKYTVFVQITSISTHSVAFILVNIRQIHLSLPFRTGNYLRLLPNRHESSKKPQTRPRRSQQTHQSTQAVSLPPQQITSPQNHRGDMKSLPIARMNIVSNIQMMIIFAIHKSRTII